MSLYVIPIHKQIKTTKTVTHKLNQTPYSLTTWNQTEPDGHTVVPRLTQRFPQQSKWVDSTQQTVPQHIVSQHDPALPATNSVIHIHEVEYQCTFDNLVLEKFSKADYEVVHLESDCCEFLERRKLLKSWKLRWEQGMWFAFCKENCSSSLDIVMENGRPESLELKRKRSWEIIWIKQGNLTRIDSVSSIVLVQDSNGLYMLSAQPPQLAVPQNSLNKAQSLIQQEETSVVIFTED